MTSSPSKRLFGTDGIRGVANQYPMTAEIALSVGRSLASIFKNGDRPRILIGKDTRLSGYMIETALASGICSMGADVFLVGPMPTPGVAFLTQAMRMNAGVMISASHNPFQDNGIKIFDRQGFKLPDEVEHKIEQLISSGELNQHRPTAEQIGKATRVDDARGRYIEFLKSTFSKELSLEGIKVVIDAAHGACYQIAPTIIEELGAHVTLIGAEPDGLNINEGVGAVHPQKMAAKVKEVGAHVGIALDGDGDRVIFADEKGQVVDGDAILAVCAGEMIRRGQLKEKTLVASVMSNQGVEDYLTSCGGKVIRSRVGDRYVVEAMRQGGFNFGGENSGHLIFLEHATTGDGLVAALQVLSMIVEQKKKLSELVAAYSPYPQILKSLRVKERRDLSLIPDVQAMIEQFEKTLGHQGRILIRYSGTEPVLRIMIEGQQETQIKKMVGDLTICIEKNLRA